MQDTTHLLLIDGNNIGYAAMYQPALSRLAYRGMATGGILGLAQSVMRISALFPQAVPIVLWDGHAQWRKDLFPDYKANRKDTPEKIEIAEKWRTQAPHAQTLLLQMGVPQVRAADAEADDLAYRICRGSETEAFTDHTPQRITLVSNDKDWLQALSETTDWLSPITNKRADLSDLSSGESNTVDDGPFRDTDDFILAKAIAGDKSDNIDGVPGVGSKTAAKLLARHGDLEGLQAAVISGAAKDTKSREIVKNMALIERNRHLMDWRRAPAPQEVGMMRESFDATDCRDLCEHLGLENLAKRLSESGDWSQRVMQWPMSAGLDHVERALWR